MRSPLSGRWLLLFLLPKTVLEELELSESSPKKEDEYE